MALAILWSLAAMSVLFWGVQTYSKVVIVLVSSLRGLSRPRKIALTSLFLTLGRLWIVGNLPPVVVGSKEGSPTYGHALYYTLFSLLLPRCRTCTLVLSIDWDLTHCD